MTCITCSYANHLCAAAVELSCIAQGTLEDNIAYPQAPDAVMNNDCRTGRTGKNKAIGESDIESILFTNAQASLDIKFAASVEDRVTIDYLSGFRSFCQPCRNTNPNTSTLVDTKPPLAATSAMSTSHINNTSIPAATAIELPAPTPTTTPRPLTQDSQQLELQLLRVNQQFMAHALKLSNLQHFLPFLTDYTATTSTIMSGDSGHNSSSHYNSNSSNCDATDHHGYRQQDEEQLLLQQRTSCDNRSRRRQKK